MILPTRKPITYISPSAYKNWVTCQMKIYLGRLAGNPFVEAPQSEAAAAGVAFDAFVKRHLARKFNIHDNPRLDLDRLLSNIKLPNKNEIVERMRPIAKHYVESKPYQKLLQAREVKIEQEAYMLFGGVPILGILDANFDGIVHDWKVRGAYSKNHTSPKPGYERRIDNGVEVPPHENRGCPLEERDEEWAIQMVFYCWLTGMTLTDGDYPVVIHEIIINRNNNNEDKITIAVHDTFVRNKFGIELFDKVTDMWNHVMGTPFSAEIQEPQPAIRRCENYGVLCEVAQYCEAYQNTVGDPERRKFYV